MKHHYITAVIEMLESGKDISDVLSRLKETLERKGHTSLHTAILQGVVVKLSARKSSATVVTVKDASDIALQKELILKTLAQLNVEEPYETVFDDTIIGGHLAVHNNVLIDKSYKTTLTKLYRSITH